MKYPELNAQAEALAVKREQARRDERQTALEKVCTRGREDGLTPEQVFGAHTRMTDRTIQVT
ncbi:hypothetical protein [Paraburkholderia xenovorans]|uniref:hypothetical protein n=1 Tax=Paraburkholderia xenovorans TaxID=36873 RepID=UPI0011D1139E|nr:hypothetical protein [Paraburkholderia xenovorans]